MNAGYFAWQYVYSYDGVTNISCCYVFSSIIRYCSFRSQSVTCIIIISNVLWLVYTALLSSRIRYEDIKLYQEMNNFRQLLYCKFICLSVCIWQNNDITVEFMCVWHTILQYSDTNTVWNKSYVDVIIVGTCIARLHCDVARPTDDSLL
jgi:hypothetical protein